MQQVQTEDISVPWGQAPDPLDQQFGKWRLSVFQDVQESWDASKLYFLYDPMADESCQTTGARKAMTCLVVFDTNRKCFVGEIPLRVQGRAKFLFALKVQSQAGGTAFALVSQSEDYNQYVMHVWRLNLSADGMQMASEPASLLQAPLIIDEEWICTMREDAPELVVVHGPGLNVVRVHADAYGPQQPIDRFSVPGSQLSHFYDGFLSRGSIYFVSASPDGHFDHSRIHALNLDTRGPIATHYLHQDPQRGFPTARKQAALDSISGFILLAGGEIDYGNGNVARLVDYWTLDLTNFTWHQVPAQMPVPLIEPRLTTANSGNVYVWGDFDQPLPGMPPQGTHVRILRVRNLNMTGPPKYDQQPQQQMPMGGGGGYGWQGPPGGASGAPPYPAAGGPAPGGGYGYGQGAAGGAPPPPYSYQQKQ
ncbi:hypothetical protein niasHT_037839 [Heterodera trifolii]|uniref:Uncharacterized protein n=1 Tax=Heterodera trifolii TaxID=157864 RepID=A0ABD2ISJ3_9BILA